MPLLFAKLYSCDFLVPVFLAVLSLWAQAVVSDDEKRPTASNGSQQLPFFTPVSALNPDLNGAPGGNHAPATGKDKDCEKKEAKIYIKKIFDKYGSDGTLTFEGFEHLIENLGLGNVQIEDHDIHDHFMDEGFLEFHEQHEHNVSVPSATKEEHSEHDHEHPGDHEHHGEPDHHGDQDNDEPHSQVDHNHEHHDEHHDDDGDEDGEHQGGGDEHRDDDHDRDAHEDVAHQGGGDEHHDDGAESTKHGQAKDAGRRRGKETDPAAPGHHDDVEADRDQHLHRGTRSIAAGDHRQCLKPREMLSVYKIQISGTITRANFLHLCPAILYQIDDHACSQPPPCKNDFHQDKAAHCKSFQSHSHGDGHHEHGDHDDDDDVHDHHDNNTHKVPIHQSALASARVWGFALLSVTVISLVGLFSVAIIPIMNKVFYNHLLQLLVGLAVGSLTGDAVLHLLPHSILSHEEGSHDNESAESEGEGHGATDDHTNAVWKGMAVLAGVYLFFLMERLMAIFSEWKRTRRKPKHRTAAAEMCQLDLEGIGQKLSRHNDNFASCQDFTMVIHPSKDMKLMADDVHEELKELKEEDEGQGQDHDQGQGHGHGHSHTVPTSVSSIAWMVIMGDGLHNFSDGLAIGAAFASSLTVGLSTSIAVFCHELPHELGDFAVLLRAGMPVKQALCYNVVSSVLCFVGMVLGIVMGNISEASSWIFAVTAGMFIYISLVDMLPQLTSVTTRKGEHRCLHLAIQMVGISIGVGIMLMIALFEDKIQVDVGDDVV